MKYVKQVLIILFFSFLGEVLQSLIPLPIPAAIYGLILMLLALAFKILKPEAVQEASHFLINIMPLMFVAPAVNILSYWDILSPNIVPIAVIVVVSTILVFAVSGLVTRLLHKKEEPHA